MDEEFTFGQWLRTSRRGHDLTQAELARKVGCAAGTIRKLESDELRPSREIAARIAAQFAVPAAEGEAFVAFARGLADLPLRQRRALRPSATTVARGAPPCEPSQPLPLPATPLIGREQEVAAVRQQLSQPAVRLVTLTGPGGIGKTRLALQVAAELLNEFANGVWFIDLAPLSTPQLVAARIATTLGVQVAGDEQIVVKLKGYLSEKQLLLVLDNFEQVVEAAMLVADLLQAVPGLKVLVTSRVALHLSSEREVPVPPLSVPDPQHLPALASLTQYEAVRLFIERAQAVKPDFLVTNANALAVAEICVHLDGLPLAIELAAARSKLFTPEALLRRLEHRLAMLTGGARDLPARQQTLRATLDWSYNLLDVEARQLFRALGMFRGSFSLTAVEQVCYSQRPPPDVVDRVSSLVDQSLLTSREGSNGQPRCMMLETVREYAVQKLREAGEYERLRAAYVQYYRLLLDRLTVNFQMSPEDPQGVALVLEEDYANFQAVQYVAEPPDDVALQREIGRHQLAHTARPVQVEGSILIRRPIEEVFAYLTTPENYPQWNFLIKEAYPLQEGPTSVGTTWGVRASLLGRRLEQIIRISEYRANERLELQTVRGPLNITYRFTFVEHAAETLVTYTWTGHLSQVFHFTHPLLTRIVSRNISTMSTRMKGVLEAQTAG